MCSRISGQATSVARAFRRSRFSKHIRIAAAHLRSLKSVGRDEHGNIIRNQHETDDPYSLGVNTIDKYWNHNTAFHEELVADAKIRGRRVLDVGCGDGLLIQRLAPFAQQVVGIDPDAEAIVRAKKRLAGISNVSLITGDFLAMPIPSHEERYDTVICVATLHHMELRAALLKMSQVLAPGGRVLIIGLAADKSIIDYFVSGLLVLPIRFMDRLHGGMQDIGVRIAEPKESISEIREVSQEVLPGSMIRRRFYYRYSLSWNKPKDSNE